jgi:hypothetical protein
VIAHDGAWLPSVYLWLPVLAVSLVAILALIVVFYIEARVMEDMAFFWIFGGMAIVAALILIITPLASYYPYHGDYHRLQPATGTVQAVDTRFLAASQYVVVTYDTGLVVRCDDSRCATVRPGEQLRLLCTKEHQFGSPLAADGWGCRWGEQ